MENGPLNLIEFQLLHYNSAVYATPDKLLKQQHPHKVAPNELLECLNGHNLIDVVVPKNWLLFFRGLVKGFSPKLLDYCPRKKSYPVF
jgi:hypothetical protein